MTPAPSDLQEFEKELDGIYYRCDVSNNQIGDSLSLDEFKQEILAKVRGLVEAARIDEVQSLYFDISSHEGNYVKGRCLQYLNEREQQIKAHLQAQEGGERSE